MDKIYDESNTPLYVQIAEKLREAIKEGDLAPGKKLSQRKIAQQFNVSRKPAAEAIEILEAEGLVETYPKSGTLVTNNVWAHLNRTRDSFWHTYIKSGHNKPSPSDMVKVFSKMEDASSIKINSDRIASSFSPHLPLVNAMKNVSRRLQNTEDLGYFGQGGLVTLRRALCKHMARYGISANESEVVVTSGIGESLYLICGAFIGVGANFFHETPSFINSTMLVHSTGCNMHEISMDDEGISAAELGMKLRRTKNAILYTQPVNHIPTGTHMSKERRNQILGICGEFGVPIIENDMFRDFYYERPFPRPMKAFDHSNQIIYVGTLLNGFMGYKLSWVLAPRFITDRIKDISTHIELVPNIFVHMFADEMLTSGYYYEYLDEIRPLMTAHYYTVQSLLKKYLGDIATWREDNPSFYIWLSFRENINILERFCESKEYLFYPGVMFDWRDKNHVRLNIFAVKTSELENWIKMISTLLRS